MGPQIEAFTFGDPEPVLDRLEIAGYFQSTHNGRWYEPPHSFDGLAKLLRSSVHHESAIRTKVNILTSCYKPHKLLDRMGFRRLAMDFLLFGNGWIERQDNWLGQPLTLRPTQALWTRVTRDQGAMMMIEGREHHFAPGSTLHIQDPDVSQEIYGVPGYLSALQSALLNEAATLFRRKYYKNGSHAGFILYMTDPAQDPADVSALRDALKSAKGPGNFRNLFLYSPNGKPDGIKIIPVAEVMAKDEFLNIKTLTRDDILAIHRVPPQLLGVPPANTGGFGDAEKAARIFARNELTPIQTLIADPVNDWIGQSVITFDAYSIPADPTSDK